MANEGPSFSTWYHLWECDPVSAITSCALLVQCPQHGCRKSTTSVARTLTAPMIQTAGTRSGSAEVESQWPIPQMPAHHCGLVCLSLFSPPPLCPHICLPVPIVRFIFLCVHIYMSALPIPVPLPILTPICMVATRVR